MVNYSYIGNGDCNKDMKKILKRIIKLPFLLCYRLFVLMNRTDKRIILFESNLGRNYSGNPRFIYEEMVRRGLDKSFRCYFILEDVALQLPGNAVKVRRKSLRYFYLFARAGFWVSDTRMPQYLVKKKGTIYIQTWHGTPLKRLALDMDNVMMEGETSLARYKRNFIKNVSAWDYLISQNAYSTEILRRAFDFHKEILEIGYPRNDLLVNSNHECEINRIKRKLQLPMDKKVILYAPTWRDDEHNGGQVYQFGSPIDYSYMKKELADDYILLVKAHYLVGLDLDTSVYRDFLYCFGADFDITELYLVSDLLITDYSSVMFDYSILRRPMLFYAYDLENYREHLRGFYFDYEREVPGPVVTTTRQLVEAILADNYSAYQERYDAFVKKFNHADDGKASERIVNLILEKAQISKHQA